MLANDATQTFGEPVIMFGLLMSSDFHFSPMIYLSIFIGSSVFLTPAKYLLCIFFCPLQANTPHTNTCPKVYCLSLFLDSVNADVNCAASFNFIARCKNISVQALPKTVQSSASVQALLECTTISMSTVFVGK